MIFKYKPIIIKRKVKTYCNNCNKKLNRIISEFFTMNPFNELSYEENIKKINDILNIEEINIISNGAICRKCEEINE